MCKFKKILTKRNSEEPLPESISKMIEIYEGFEELAQSQDHSENEDLQAKMRITDKLICERLDKLEQTEDSTATTEPAKEKQDNPDRKSLVKIIEQLYRENGKETIYTIDQLQNAGINIDFESAKIQIGSYCLTRPLFTIRKVFRIEKK